MFATLFARVVPVRPGEAVPMLLAYYLLRPVRDEIGAADRGNLQLLWSAVFVVMLLVVRVLYDSSRHALAKPAREVLFTRLSRGLRYKSKAFIDTALCRGGDLLGGWLYAGFAARGLGAAAIALAAAPVAVLWVVLGWRLGRSGRAGMIRSILSQPGLCVADGRRQAGFGPIYRI